MPGWNLKKGDITDSRVSEDEYWSLFNFVFSDACKKTNTYKFGLIKALCDQVYDLYEDETGAFFLSYENLFSKFAENYWNLVNKYQLKQMSYNGKSEFSKIEIIIKSAANIYEIPESVGFLSINADDRQKIIKTVTAECKRCVIGALYNDFEGKLYAFDLKGDGIFLNNSAYWFISKFKLEIERLNYYAWAKFLEKINDDDALIKVLEKLELATPQRKDLSMYRDILYKEFQEDRCFYCGRKLNDNMHVDHFIPWAFVKTDNLWNFVLACPRCNLKKKDRLVQKDYITKIDRRNSTIIEYTHETRDPVLQKEMRGYYDGLIDKMWNYARMSGIREDSQGA